MRRSQLAHIPLTGGLLYSVRQRDPGTNFCRVDPVRFIGATHAAEMLHAYLVPDAPTLCRNEIGHATDTPIVETLARPYGQKARALWMVLRA
jgi:hypothetical protein